ncbi:MAG: hypothetical protein HYR56_33750 [Acidobacteria bacterium]|nr:hypothetical protein [Acidobacteriota bacterium]MBI3422925.1 hypothetical protein [Acidobacteriota bacterium]
MSEELDDLDVAVTGAAVQPSTPAASGAAQPLAAQRQFALIGLVSLIACLVVYVLRLDRVVGTFVDDAWYVVLAQALATGQGYSLINCPTPGLLPLYPPAFPFFLSLVYRLSPTFPENLWLLKAVSISAMLGAGVLTFRYFVKVKSLTPYAALGIAVATVVAPPLVFLATSTLMSECFFTCALLLTVWLVERCREAEPQQQWRWAVLAGLAASVTFLTRSIALGALAAAFFYLLKERLPRAASVFTLTVALICGPWVLYSNAHAPALTQETQEQGHIVQPYLKQFWQKRAGDVDSGEETWRDLPGRMARNLGLIARVDLLRSMAAPLVELFYGQADPEGATATPWSMLLLSLLLTALTLLGYASACRNKVTYAELLVPCLIFVIVLWPWPPFRLILPLLPFWYYYFLLGLRQLAQRFFPAPSVDGDSLAAGSPRQAWVMNGALAVFVALGFFGNLSYLAKQYDTSVVASGGLPGIFTEVENQFKFLNRQLKPGEVVASANPPLTFLFTGHKTIGVGESSKVEGLWKQLGIRYIMNVNLFERGDDPTQTGYRVVYQSRRYPHQIWIVTLTP